MNSLVSWNPWFITMLKDKCLCLKEDAIEKKCTPSLLLFSRLVESGSSWLSEPLQIHVHHSGNTVYVSQLLSSSSSPAFSLPHHEILLQWFILMIFPKYFLFGLIINQWRRNLVVFLQLLIYLFFLSEGLSRFLQTTVYMCQYFCIQPY